MLHEPGLYALLDDFDAFRSPIRALVERGMEAGGPPAAVERFWRYLAGDDGWNQLAPALRERLRARASTLFEVELGTYELYLPDDDTLAAIRIPVALLVSENGLPAFAEVASRRSPRRAPRRRCADHAGQARGLSRVPQRALGNHTPIPP
jgi:hypothetical protein